MAISFETQNREAFILFGNVVADVLRRGVVSLEGHSDGGKSLLALAADAELHPARYEPNGITPITKVHKQIGIDAPGRQSVYFSDGLSEFFTHNVAAAKWQKFLDKNPQIKLVYLSNVWNWTSDSVNPKDPAVFADNKVPVQARIKVEVIDTGEFVRSITLTCVQPELEQVIKARFEARLKATQPAPRNQGPATAAVKPNECKAG